MLRLLRDLWNELNVAIATEQLKYLEDSAYEIVEALESDLTPNPKNERYIDETDYQSIRNWQRVPLWIRTTAQEVLEEHVPQELVTKWQDQMLRDVSIGSDDLWFHFGHGMLIRNLLRKQVPDLMLPPTAYPHGLECNWDDFYMGALYAFVNSPRV